MPVIVSGIRDTETQLSQGQAEVTPETYLDYFCPAWWSFQDFRHNKDEVWDWAFMKESMVKGSKIDRRISWSKRTVPVGPSSMTTLEK